MPKRLYLTEEQKKESKRLAQKKYCSKIKKQNN